MTLNGNKSNDKKNIEHRMTCIIVLLINQKDQNGQNHDTIYFTFMVMKLQPIKKATLNF